MERNMVLDRMDWANSHYYLNDTISPHRQAATHVERRTLDLIARAGSASSRLPFRGLIPR